MAKVINYSFPGNVRELENILKRAIELCSGEIIGKEDICNLHTISSGESIKRKNRRIDDLIAVLLECNGSKTEAAKKLGISRVHLYRLLQNRNTMNT